MEFHASCKMQFPSKGMTRSSLARSRNDLRAQKQGSLVEQTAPEYALAGSPVALPFVNGIRLSLRRPTWIQCTTCSGESVAALQTLVLTC